jgi:hypothetical protein
LRELALQHGPTTSPRGDNSVKIAAKKHVDFLPDETGTAHVNASLHLNECARIGLEAIPTVWEVCAACHNAITVELITYDGNMLAGLLKQDARHTGTVGHNRGATIAGRAHGKFVHAT